MGRKNLDSFLIEEANSSFYFHSNDLYNFFILFIQSVKARSKRKQSKKKKQKKIELGDKKQLFFFFFLFRFF